MCVIKRRAKEIGDEKNLKRKMLQTQTPKPNHKNTLNLISTEGHNQMVCWVFQKKNLQFSKSGFKLNFET
jgi:hypothetical protein